MLNWLNNMLGADSGPTVARDPEAQARVDEACRSLSVYHYNGCPFCTRVRKALTRLGLDVELRDIHGADGHREDLVRGGGRKTVPCLRIDEPDGETRWMYESADIVRYLEQRFT